MTRRLFCKAALALPLAALPLAAAAPTAQPAARVDCRLYRRAADGKSLDEIGWFDQRDGDVVIAEWSNGARDVWQVGRSPTRAQPTFVSPEGNAAVEVRWSFELAPGQDAMGLSRTPGAK